MQCMKFKRGLCYLPYNSIYRAFLKRQNYWNRKQISSWRWRSDQEMERGLLQRRTGEFGDVMELFYILLWWWLCECTYQNLQNCTIKRANFTIRKLYLKMGEKRPFIRGFCFPANIFMSTSISNVCQSIPKKDI